MTHWDDARRSAPTDAHAAPARRASPPDGWVDELPTRRQGSESRVISVGQSAVVWSRRVNRIPPPVGAIFALMPSPVWGDVAPRDAA